MSFSSFSEQAEQLPVHFDASAKLGEADLRAMAGARRLDLTAYDSCRGENAPSTIIEADKSEAEAFGVTGTPTFFFGTLEAAGSVRVTDVLVGAKDISAFRAILDRLLRSRS